MKGLNLNLLIPLNCLLGNFGIWRVCTRDVIGMQSNRKDLCIRRSRGNPSGFSNWILLVCFRDNTENITLVDDEHNAIFLEFARPLAPGLN